MNRGRFASLACALAALLLGSAQPASAQGTDELFDPGTLQELQLLVNSRDVELLHQNFEENTYYPADLVWRGMRVRSVGIRSRGGGSRNPTKLGLEVDFNRYVSGQEFLRLRSLVLDNLWQDPAMIRERIAMALFARLGQPAPREAFGRVYINGVYQGLYTLVEPIDRVFLARAFGEDTGYLFEYEFQRSFYGEYLGDDFEPYKAMLEAETHETQSDSVLYEPIRDMFRELNGEDDGTWESRSAVYLDLPHFIRQVAIETFLSETDGLLGYIGMNNFFLYRGADTSAHRVIPWDKDVAFGASESSVLLRADENVIMRRLLTRDALRTMYLDVLEQCARAVLEDDWLAKEIEAAAALIMAAAHEDALKPVSNDEFEAAVQFLREFARRRPSFVLQEVAALRRR